MLEYPKIETLYNRDDKFKVKTDEFRLSEFGLINQWLITEKIDGTNIRVMIDHGRITFGGRTDNAQIPTFLLATLQSIFTEEAYLTAFLTLDAKLPEQVCLFGEGYGEKIQKVGSRYRKGTSFRLFDVWVDGWWLNWSDVEDVARKLGIQTVPVLAHVWVRDVPDSYENLQFMFPMSTSMVAGTEGDPTLQAEGVVARTDPLLFDRRGHRVMWKLKFKDFAE